MLLAIDIGNTNITLGLFNGARLVRRASIPTKEKKYSLRLKRILGKDKIDDALICSVVPKATGRLVKDLRRLFFKGPYIIGKDIVVPIKNLYRNPGQVGQDRLVNAYAGAMLYGTPLIVIDFGTAVTFDVISKDRGYLGGLILPGMNLSLSALSEHTALLPRVELAKPKEFIGRDTKNSMLSGIVYGFAALTDDIISRLKKKIGKARVIATGGDAKIVSGYAKSLSKVDTDLTLKGIALTFYLT